MNKSESKYFNTANRFDEAFLYLLGQKDFEYITIKEICQTAGVNRSTFYLHYENIDDLLTESNQYIVNKFLNTIGGQQLNQTDIQNKPIQELNFVTPQYLIPWLQFIKSNKALFKTYLNKFSTLTIEKNNKLLFNKIVSPILERYHIQQTDKPYIVKFYIEGIMAIVKLWVTNGCKEEIEHMCQIIVNCVNYKRV